jgi:hypothetical protein
LMSLDPKILASFLRKAYSLRDEISDEQPTEQVSSLLLFSQRPKYIR